LALQRTLTKYLKSSGLALDTSGACDKHFKYMFFSLHVASTSLQKLE
jgi:hypothetical protein